MIMAKIPVTGFTMGMPKGMNRMEPFALDLSSVYTSYNAMETYAKTSAISYIGQILSLINYAEDGTTITGVTVYSIQDEAGTLKEVGTVPVGDEKTIVVAENGTISLAGVDELVFEKEVEDEEGNKSTVEVKYQALLTKDGLTWIEPSATTVEGLDARLKIVEKDVVDLKEDVSNINDTIGDTTKGLTKDVLDNKNAINAINETLNGTDDNDGLIAKVSDIEEKIGSQSTEDNPATGLYADIDNLNLGKADKLVEGDLIKVEETVDEDSGLNITKVSVKTNNIATRYDPGKLYKVNDIVYTIEQDESGDSPDCIVRYFICIEENDETIVGMYDLSSYHGLDDDQPPVWATFIINNEVDYAFKAGVAEQAEWANVAEYASEEDAENDETIASKLRNSIKKYSENVHYGIDDLVYVLDPDEKISGYVINIYQCINEVAPGEANPVEDTAGLYWRIIKFDKSNAASTYINEEGAEVLISDAIDSIWSDLVHREYKLSTPEDESIILEDSSYTSGPDGEEVEIPTRIVKVNTNVIATKESVDKLSESVNTNAQGISVNATAIENLKNTEIKANANAILAIKDGEEIDSFADVEAKISSLKDTEIKSNTDAIDAVEEDIGLVDNLETTNKTLVGAINEVRNSVSAGGIAATITIDTNTTTEGALKSYTIKQGENTVGTIDIPKDMVVTSGEVVVDPEGQESGTYIKLVLANVTEPLYINVGTLVDIYKAKANAAQVQIAIDSSTREISASIVAGSIGTIEIADNAITTVKIADANVTKAKLSTDVQASLDKADSALTDAKAYADSELIRLLSVERIG